MKNILIILILLSLTIDNTYGQKLKLGEQEFELKNVTGSIIEFQGEKVLKIERDLNAIPFDEARLEATVDEPTFARLADLDFENGTIEVKMYSQLQDPMPQDYQHAQGFIGVAFRVGENEKAYESIYLRPKVGRSDNQRSRNHTVQYYAYPDYKFETLRKAHPGKYETSAPVDIHEWITMRIEVNGKKAEMFVNDAKYSTFVVDSMLSTSSHGGIGLYVDMGTIGYFKDLKVTSLQDPVNDIVKDWERAKAYTKEYLDAMPESSYGLKPTPEMRSFAEQMLHLTDANYGFASAATGVENPIGRGESENTADKSKENVTKLVMAGYDFVIDNIRKMTADQLNESVQLFGRFEMSKGTALAKCFEHQTHHRGQTTVYLRLAGVKPPQEKLF
ncbi:DinB family protein [Flavilitoribacter nigricans]|nr:DinB family protein [Flavilitoribacter nigricans]